MFKNKKIFYGALIIAVLVIGGISWFILNRSVPPPVPVVPPTIASQEPVQGATTTENKSKTTAKITEIILSGPRGDEEEPGPIEEDCQKVLKSYIRGSIGAFQFQNMGFTDCKLIESKVGWKKTFDESECPSGISPQGCYICKLECR